MFESHRPRDEGRGGHGEDRRQKTSQVAGVREGCEGAWGGGDRGSGDITLYATYKRSVSIGNRLHAVKTKGG